MDTPVDTSVPLIWTTHGNLPEASLRRIPLWNVGETVIEFVEEFYLGDELVKRNVNILQKEMPT